MAQHSTDFADSGYGTGAQPPDWTAQYDAALSAAKADFTVEADGTGSSFGDQILQVDYIASGNSALSWDDVGSNADVDIAIRVRWTQTVIAQKSVGIVARGDEDSNGYQGYNVVVDTNADTFMLRKLVNGSDTTLVTALYYDGIDANSWYWIRFQLSGTALKVRFWRDGDDEPATWDIDTTDGSITAAGWCGVHVRYGGDGEVDWFGVGTGGDAPPSAPAAEGDARVTQVAVQVMRQNRRSQSGNVIVAG